jgi:uncharacterized protein (TIGR03382 family)
MNRRGGAWEDGAMEAWKRGVLAVLAAGLALPARAQVASLPVYDVDPATVTVAGISSGGFMAVQLHVAFSSRIHGAAIFAGGPFYCAQDSVSTAESACESGSGLTLSSFVDYTNAEADAGAIDSPANLAAEPVYLFSGTDDTTVHQATMDVLQQYYQAFSVSNLTYDDTTAAAHGWISPDGPNACDSSYSPYINNCSIDPEQTFLTQFYGSLNAKNTGTLGGSFIQFDQTPFCPGGSCSAISMDSSGWVYAPASCTGGGACRLVVALHGCLQSQSVVQEDFVKESGLDEWADTNGIVVLYPQAIASSTPNNPEGCWDWWGYTGASYALQSGPQMAAIAAMIEQVTGQVVVTSGTSGGASGTSGGAGSTGGACTGLAQACTANTVCCAGTSCQFSLCLPGSSSAGSSGASSSTGGGSSSGGGGVSGGSSSAGTVAGGSSGGASTAGGATATGGQTGTSGGVAGSGAGGGTTGTASGASAALSVSAIVPASGSSDSTTLVTLEGTGFLPSAQVLVGTTELDLVDVQSPAVLAGVVPSGLAKGTYDVTVLNPDGARAVLSKAFTVAAPSGGCSSGGGPAESFACLGLALWLGRRRRCH